MLTARVPRHRFASILRWPAPIDDANRADKSIWGIRHLNGIATLVRIPPPYKQWDRVHSFAYGTVLYDPHQEATRVQPAR